MVVPLDSMISFRSMIEKPTHGERLRLLGGGGHRDVVNYRIFRRWGPLKLIIFTAIVLIALMAVISGLIQKGLWMRQLGYPGVFLDAPVHTVGAVLPCSPCGVSVPLDQSSPGDDTEKTLLKGHTLTRSCFF